MSPQPMSEVDPDDGEEFPISGLDDPLWSKEPMYPDSQEYLCVHKLPMPSNPTPATQSSGHASNPTPATTIKWTCQQLLTPVT